MPNHTHSTTQSFLAIYDITHNLVIMKDGAASTIIAVDAMNFGLLAEEEQDAIMYAYAALLNSLNYPVHIVIQSQTKDVTNYLNTLQAKEAEITSSLMKKRVQSYREFVANLIRDRNVLDKKFYVVIHATSLEMGFIGPSNFVPGKADFDVSTVERGVIIEKATNILEPKKDHLISQFARIGLYARQLETQEIIRLFYANYNPESAEGQIMADSRSYTAPLVVADTKTQNEF
jgi:hypothetical protein